MLPLALTDPKSILIIGGSNNQDHLGGSVLKNLIENDYRGDLFVLNPKRDLVQGVSSFRSAEEVPPVDLAIFAIPAPMILPIMETLILKKEIRAFMIYSAGFAEFSEEGALMEKEILDLVDRSGSCLLGPNNIGLANLNFSGIFTKPVPKLHRSGVDFVSGSGATAVFTVELAIEIGLAFNSLITVGNSTQIGVEEVLEHWDESFDTEDSPRVKMMYIESIRKPQKFLDHCTSLKKKGCQLIALKAGTTSEGSQAAASHTGAIANPEVFVQAMMDKAGIVRCRSRQGLVSLAGLFQLGSSTISNVAIITHAGGPAVILTDQLTRKGLHVPEMPYAHREALKHFVSPGASVNNPIDLLATGTAEELELVIRYCDEEVQEVDCMIVIFGSPGLGSVERAYEVIDRQASRCSKPLIAVLPSVVNLKQEIALFLDKGNIAFFDESLVGWGLGKIFQAQTHLSSETDSPSQRGRSSNAYSKISSLIRKFDQGFLPSAAVADILDLISFPRVKQQVLTSQKELYDCQGSNPFPWAMKAEGVLHKTDQNAVLLNIDSADKARIAFHELLLAKGSQGVLVQPMLSGLELFIGAERKADYPPLILFGLGGIFVEHFEHLTFLAPLTKGEVLKKFDSFKGIDLLKGIRGQKPVDLDALADLTVSISDLMIGVPEISEIDINPLIAHSEGLSAVDVRIRHKMT